MVNLVLLFLICKPKFRFLQGVNMGFFTYIFPLAVNIFEYYIRNSSSKKDDAVLEIVKQGASYLANKGNNNITKNDCDIFKNKKVVK